MYLIISYLLLADVFFPFRSRILFKYLLILLHLLLLLHFRVIDVALAALKFVAIFQIIFLLLGADGDRDVCIVREVRVYHLCIGARACGLLCLEFFIVVWRERETGFGDH